VILASADDVLPDAPLVDRDVASLVLRQFA
jgi:hypothetical protein